MTPEQQRIDELTQQLNAANDRIQRLEEELMEVKNKHAVLIADVVLNEDRVEQIKRLREANFQLREGAEEQKQRIKRLEEVRGNVSKETIQSDSSIWAKAGIGFTTEAKQ